MDSQKSTTNGSSKKIIGSNLTKPTESSKRKAAGGKHATTVVKIELDEEKVVNNKAKMHPFSKTLKTPKKTGKIKEIDSDNTADMTPGSMSSGSSANKRPKFSRNQIPVSQTPRNAPLKKITIKSSNKEEEKKESQPPALPSKEKVGGFAASKVTTFIDHLQKVEFRVFYQTIPGQDLYIIGSHDSFGHWDEHSLGIQMKWNEGHIWTKELSIKEIPSKFEFKFIVKEADGNVTWELRDNRVYDTTKIKYTLTTSHRLKSKGQTSLDKGATKLEYSGDDGIAHLTYEWGK